MKYTQGPRQVSFFLSCVLSGIVIIFILILDFFSSVSIQLWALFVLALLCIPSFYLLLRISINNFIYKKIIILYKTIRGARLLHENHKITTVHSRDILEDVSKEVNEWADSQQKEIAELKRLEEYRREFLGNVSHELKTPITTIQGYVLTLLDGGISDPKVNVKYLIRTAKNINRLIAIVKDLETISNFEAGVITVDEIRFNIVLLIKDVFESMEIKASKRKIHFMFEEIPEDAIYVIADKNKIRQVLINLIDNSLKYGTDDGYIKVSISDMHDHILIEVSDNGIGIEENDIHRVFERFYRTDKSRARAQGGSGLGLAIVKHIIEAHKQSIYVTSKVGEGSTFSFTLRKG